MISIVSLLRITQYTERAYKNDYKHGFWGQLKAGNKSSDLSFEFATTLHMKQKNLPMHPTYSFIYRLMAHVKSGGHHKVGSYRTILVQELYSALGFGEIHEEDLAENPKWREVRDLVHDKLNEIANDPAWQETFGIEYLTFDDHVCLIRLLRTQPKLQPQLESLGLEPYDRRNDNLIANCQVILGLNEDAQYHRELAKQVHNKEDELIDEIKAAGHEKHTEARLLSTVKTAAGVLLNERVYRFYEREQLPFNPLPEETLGFWLENGPVKAQNEKHPVIPPMFRD